MDYMMSISPSTKIFLSVNRSNNSMQKVFNAKGFIQIGIIGNLNDEIMKLYSSNQSSSYSRFRMNYITRTSTQF